VTPLELWSTGAGDAGYEVSQLSSGSVTASTLTVLRRGRDDRSSPRVFETVLTSQDGTVQYQLRTHVRQTLAILSIIINIIIIIIVAFMHYV